MVLGSMWVLGMEPGPLEEQQVLLNAAPSPQPLVSLYGHRELVWPGTPVSPRDLPVSASLGWDTSTHHWTWLFPWVLGVKLRTSHTYRVNT